MIYYSILLFRIIHTIYTTMFKSTLDCKSLMIPKTMIKQGAAWLFRDRPLKFKRRELMRNVAIIPAALIVVIFTK